MAIYHIATGADYNFILIQAISGCDMTDIAGRILNIHVCLYLHYSFDEGRRRGEFFELTIMETIRDDLAVEGTLVFILGDTLRNAGVMEQMHGAAINEAGIFI